jgi:predicted TIM-barrel fold metal-dependent hydrolase
MVAVDLHQHLWPEPFVELLRRRTRAPYLRDWRLVVEGEPAYDVQPADHEVGRRIEQDRQAGIRLACVSLSAPLGIESLPRDESGALIDAWHEGALALPDHFAPWASVSTEEPDLVGLTDLLGGPFVGVQLPATTLGDPLGWHAAAEVLRVAELAGKPVFVHPGPTPPTVAVPSWWAPVVGYVAQLQAAWWAWHAFGGRSQFPRLKLVFAAGAGLAPVHHERLTARGGSFGPVDPNVFVDTSSYGAQGLDALVRALGIDVVVLGSDRPYAEPLQSLLGEAATQAVRVDNPRRALGSHPGPALESAEAVTPRGSMGAVA